MNTSLISLLISLVWHFNLFWQHFMFTSMTTYFDFMRIPACGFFLQSLIFEFRLIQEVFKAHYHHLLRDDPESFKKKLVFMYLILYACFIGLMVWQDIFIWNKFFTVISSGCVWIP